MSPAKSFSDDSHWLLVSLRAFLVITSLPVLGAIAWTIAAHGGHSDPDVGGPINSLLLAGSCFTFAWTAIALIVRIFTRSPIHPGIYVAFDLIALLLLAITAGFVFGFSAPWQRMDSYNTDAHNTLLRVEYFSSVLSFIDCAVLLFLLGWACWATHKYRNQRVTKSVSDA